jgi:hypothetical protein
MLLVLLIKIDDNGNLRCRARGEYASRDWERMSGHPVYFAETFIDPGCFRGT